MLFTVHDTGIGIHTDKQETIFFSFNQADSTTTRKFGGSGLGLAISKQLVEMMDGSIWCESLEGQGAHFHFTVVLEPGDEQMVGSQSESVRLTVQGLCVLLVEDNEMNRDIARFVLEKDRHRVIEVENGFKGLEALAEHDIDLILMDIQMPVMDGLTTCAVIRACENGSDLSRFDVATPLEEKLRLKCHGSHVPIVAMTAHAMVGDREKCLVAGMDSYLTKPLNPAQLKTLLGHIAQPRSLADAIPGVQTAPPEKETSC